MAAILDIFIHSVILFKADSAMANRLDFFINLNWSLVPNIMLVSQSEWFFIYLPH
jgi:hypothetical protein